MAKDKGFESYAGVNICNDRIILSKIRNVNSKIILDEYKISPLPAGFIENGRITSIEILSQTLKRFFVASKSTSEYLSVTIPTNQVASKLTEGPRLKKRELISYFTSDIQEHPVLLKYKEAQKKDEDEDDDLEEENLYLAYTSIDSQDLESLRYFVLAAPYSMINSYLKLFRISDRVISSFSSDIYGVISCVQLIKSLPDESNLIIYISRYNTEYVVIKNSAVYFYHKSQINSDTLSRYPNEIIELHSRTRMVLMAYQDKYPDDQRIDKVIVVPDTKEVADMLIEQQDELKEQFSHETVIFNPSEHITFNSSLDASLLEVDIYALIPSIGVSVAASKELFYLDFFRHRTILGPFFTVNDLKYIGVTGAALAIMIFGVQWGADMYLSNLKSSFDSIRDQIQQLSTSGAPDASSKISAMRSDVEQLNSLLDNRVLRSQIIDVIAGVIPENVWLSNIGLKMSQTQVQLQLTGTGTSKQDILLFIEDLQNVFEKVELKNITSAKEDVNFSISCEKRRDEV